MSPRAEEFGPYVVYEQLGFGGMATVHRAETQGIAGFSRQIALKRMLPSVAADAGLVKSFIREAQLASHLHHANVAQTYDLGKVGDTYFIAMELVPGRNLREILKHCATVVGHMPLPIAMNIVNQICDALDYAHNLCDETGQPLGIIHRDVSPSNIIVSDGGIVKLIDFGIAKASASTGLNTQSGTIKGKFAYMAPEYLMGSLDARADLFALGVIAYELLTNRPLFQGKDDMDTLFRVKDMPIVPPSRSNPTVPPEIDSIIMTALERAPDQRWQHATALREALTTETKRVGLVAHNSQVVEWLEWAFHQTAKPTRPFDDGESEPMLSISEGTAELSQAAEPARKSRPGDAPPRRPASSARPDGWSVAAHRTTPAAGALDAVIAKERSARSPSPHVVPRRNIERATTDVDPMVGHEQEADDDDDDDTLPPDAARASQSTLDIATIAAERPSDDPAQPAATGTPRAVPPQPLAPRSDAPASTAIDFATTLPASGVGAADPPFARTLPGAGATGTAVSPTPPSALDDARLPPRMAGAEAAQAAAAAKAAIDDLAARGERPSAAKILGENGAQQGGHLHGSVVKTRVDRAKRTGASNFLLAVLVLIVAGVAAAVVYFALPYLS